MSFINKHERALFDRETLEIVQGLLKLTKAAGGPFCGIWLEHGRFWVRFNLWEERTQLKRKDALELIRGSRRPAVGVTHNRYKTATGGA